MHISIAPNARLDEILKNIHRSTTIEESATRIDKLDRRNIFLLAHLAHGATHTTNSHPIDHSAAPVQAITKHYNAQGSGSAGAGACEFFANRKRGPSAHSSGSFYPVEDPALDYGSETIANGVCFG